MLCDEGIADGSHSAAQDQSYQESTVKIELMEKRMNAVKKQGEMVAELEGKLARAEKDRQAHAEALESVQTDFDAMESEYTKLKQTAAATDKQGGRSESSLLVHQLTSSHRSYRRFGSWRGDQLRGQHGDVLPHRANRLASRRNPLFAVRELVPQIAGPPRRAGGAPVILVTTPFTSSRAGRPAADQRPSSSLLRHSIQAPPTRGSPALLYTAPRRSVSFQQQRMAAEREGAEESAFGREGARSGVKSQSREAVGDAPRHVDRAVVVRTSYRKSSFIFRRPANTGGPLKELRALMVQLLYFLLRYIFAVELRR